MVIFGRWWIAGVVSYALDWSQCIYCIDSLKFNHGWNIHRWISCSNPLLQKGFQSLAMFEYRERGPEWSTLKAWTMRWKWASFELVHRGMGPQILIILGTIQLRVTELTGGGTLSFIHGRGATYFQFAGTFWLCGCWSIGDGFTILSVADLTWAYMSHMGHLHGLAPEIINQWG